MIKQGEIISVAVAFGPPYKIKPLKFRWSGRTIEIKNITYFWKTREGASDIYHFSVSCGSSMYELSFDAASLLWRLEAVET